MQQDSIEKKARAYLEQNDLANAQTLYAEIVTANPRDSKSQFLLGIVHARQGNLLQAEQHLQQAVDIDPGLAEGWLNLGQVYELKGQYPLAEEYLLRSLVLKPTLLDARESLGRIYTMLERIDAAIEQFRLVVIQSPTRVAALHGQATALHLAGRLTEAYQICIQALSVAPGNPGILVSMGQICRGMGKLEEALQYYRKASQRVPGFEPAIYSEADVLERMGQPEQALVLLQPFLSRLQDDPELLILYTKICILLKRDETLVEQLEQALENQALDFRSRERIHYLLGDLQDKQARYEKAFEHFQAGSQSVWQRMDESKFQNETDDIIDCFKAMNEGLLPCSEMSHITPIFIIGMPRSGTTLVEQILASHPQVYGAGELNNISVIAVELGYASKAFKPDVKTLQAMARRYMDALKEKSGGALFVTDKMPGNFQFLGLIDLLFPNAKIIHTRRDPLDTCLSCYFQYFSGTHKYSYDLRQLGYVYRKYEKLMNYWRHKGISFMEVQYENLINDPEGVSRQMVEFCGLDWDENCLNFHQSGRVVGTASYNQVNKPIYTTSIGRWRHYQKFLAPLQEGLNITP